VQKVRGKAQGVNHRIQVATVANVAQCAHGRGMVQGRRTSVQACACSRGIAAAIGTVILMTLRLLGLDLV